MVLADIESLRPNIPMPWPCVGPPRLFKAVKTAAATPSAVRWQPQYHAVTAATATVAPGLSTTRLRSFVESTVVGASQDIAASRACYMCKNHYTVSTLLSPLCP